MPISLVSNCLSQLHTFRLSRLSFGVGKSVSLPRYCQWRCLQFANPIPPRVENYCRLTAARCKKKIAHANQPGSLLSRSSSFHSLLFHSIYLYGMSWINWLRVSHANMYRYFEFRFSLEACNIAPQSREIDENRWSGLISSIDFADHYYTWHFFQRFCAFSSTLIPTVIFCNACFSYWTKIYDRKWGWLYRNWSGSGQHLVGCFLFNSIIF